MAGDAKLFVRDGEAWVEHPHGAESAEALSRAHRTTVVEWSISTAVDQIWILAYSEGQLVRELRYARDDGWFERGEPLSFEDARALAPWRSERSLLASPDGYEVLEAFLGRRPPEPVVEPEATLRTTFAPVHAGELRAIADRALVPISTVLEASWQLSKLALYDRFMARANKLGLDLTKLVEDTSPPPPCEHLPNFIHEPAELPAIDLTRYQVDAIPHHLAVSATVLAELEHMATMFDVPGFKLLDQAYLLARSRLV